MEPISDKYLIEYEGGNAAVCGAYIGVSAAVSFAAGAATAGVAGWVVFGFLLAQSPCWKVKYSFIFVTVN